VSSAREPGLAWGPVRLVLRILSRRAQRILNWWYCIASSRAAYGLGVRGGASQGHQVLGDATGGTAHGLEPELLGPLVLALLAQLSHYARTSWYSN
jgi:hypothetical protein